VTSLFFLYSYSQINVETRRNAKFSDEAKEGATALLQALIKKLRAAEGATASNIKDALILTKDK